MTPPSAPGATRALIYVRASRDPKMKLRSVADQETDCRDHCESEGWAVTGVIVDANRSASAYARQEREGFAEVLERLATGDVDVLVMWESSRGARDMQGFVDLKRALVKSRTMLAYSGRLYDLSRGDDAFQAGLDALLAEKEASGIRDRIVRTVRLRAERGTPHGPIPYGYRRVYSPETGDLVEQVEDETTGPILRDIAARVLAGETLSSVARDLNRRGVPIPGKVRKPESSLGWMAKTIRQVILQPAVTGLRVHQGKVVGEASWDAIVPRDDWDQLHALLDNPNRQTHRGAEPKYLLTWIARCNACGAPMVGSNSKGSPGGKVMRCGSSACPKSCSINLQHADQFIDAAVEAFLDLQADAFAAAASDEAPEDDARVAVQNELDALTERLQEAADGFAAGSIPMATLTRIEEALRPRIDELRRQAAPPIPASEAVRVIAGANTPAKAWRAASVSAKREFLKAFFVIRILEAERPGGRFNPDRIKIERV